LEAALQGSALDIVPRNTVPPARFADTFTPTVFATGCSAYNSPDSITLGGESVWVAYTNGACSTAGGGSSTVVQYSTSGAS
jgi:hypothetical protein